METNETQRTTNKEMSTSVIPQPYMAPEGDPVQGNRILLMDGRLLECHPKNETADNHIDNEMRLDTTGVYLSTDNKKRQSKSADEPHPDRVAFLQNAFLLFENAETILSDSRMFLAHVPIQSGVAYTGTSGFQHPTLGVYIEFWQRSGMPMTIKDGIPPFTKDHKVLLYHLAGSPLSGSNNCAFVTPDGTTLHNSVSPFIAYWPLFMKINNRYNEAKVRFQGHTIREVVDKLQ